MSYKYCKGIILLLVVTISSCQKYLDQKPDQRLTIPAKLEDLQALLDNYYKLNLADPRYPAETSSDDYYLTDDVYNSISPAGLQRMYRWEKDYLFDTETNAWDLAYGIVYVANTALAKIDNVSVSNPDDYNNVKGQALYHRANAFLGAVCIWSPAYDETTADKDLGIPLRLTDDFNAKTSRSSLKQTFMQIVNDLKMAIRLLPVHSIHVMRPSKPAAYGLLARTFLYMRDYVNAGLYADSCLQLNNNLMDYNTIDGSPDYPFQQFNKEVISEMRIGATMTIHNAFAKIDSILYRSYEPDDIRKNLFFSINDDGSAAFRGSYQNDPSLFGGIATDEMYLIRAESLARQGKTGDALKALNNLLVKRWEAGTFVPITSQDPNQLLDIILLERRKELVMRGLRWMDIKRLNKEGRNIALTRKLEGKTYTLPPNDLRYALPIPEDIITLSGIEQNPR